MNVQIKRDRYPSPGQGSSGPSNQGGHDQVGRKPHSFLYIWHSPRALMFHRHYHHSKDFFASDHTVILFTIHQTNIASSCNHRFSFPSPYNYVVPSSPSMLEKQSYHHPTIIFRVTYSSPTFSNYRSTRTVQSSNIVLKVIPGMQTEAYSEGKTT